MAWSIKLNFEGWQTIEHVCTQKTLNRMQDEIMPMIVEQNNIQPQDIVQ